MFRKLTQTAFTSKLFTKKPSSFLSSRLFSSGRTQGFKLTPMNCALFGASAGGLMFLMAGNKVGSSVAQSGSVNSMSGDFQSLAIRRAQSALAYFGGSIALTGGTVYALRFTRIAYMNPWINLFATLACMIPMMLVNYHDNFYLKHLLWGGSVGLISLSLCPLINSVCMPIIYEALLGTGAMVGSLSAYAYTNDNGQFLNMRSFLALGLASMIGASVVMMFKPSPFLMNFWLYGGLALFGGYVLYDTQLLMQRARNQPDFDPINNSFGLYLDAINIFVRLVMILSSNRKK